MHIHFCYENLKYNDVVIRIPCLVIFQQPYRVPSQVISVDNTSLCHMYNILFRKRHLSSQDNWAIVAPNLYFIPMKIAIIMIFYFNSPKYMYVHVQYEIVPEHLFFLPWFWGTVFIIVSHFGYLMFPIENCCSQDNWAIVAPNLYLCCWRQFY